MFEAGSMKLHPPKIASPGANPQKVPFVGKPLFFLDAIWMCLNRCIEQSSRFSA